MVFVFGSNREGRHGAGAALFALRRRGAIYGKPEGLQGNAYAIVTKELRAGYPPVLLPEVKDGIVRFLAFAREHPEMSFEMTRIGCGLAGFKDEEIAPMFSEAPRNVFLPREWAPILSYYDYA